MTSTQITVKTAEEKRRANTTAKALDIVFNWVFDFTLLRNAVDYSYFIERVSFPLNHGDPWSYLLYSARWKVNLWIARQIEFCRFVAFSIGDRQRRVSAMEKIELEHIRNHGEMHGRRIWAHLSTLDTDRRLTPALNAEPLICPGQICTMTVADANYNNPL